MRQFIIYIYSAILLLSTLSCHRQTLEDSYQFLAYVPVTINWDESNLQSTGIDKIANVSILFYPKAGGSPVTVVSDNLFYNLVTLPIGEYSVLIYNDIYNNIRNVTFDDTNSFDDIAAHITEDTETTPLYYTSQDPETLATDHGRVAWYHVADFSVDDTMVEYTRSEAFLAYITATKSYYSSSSITTKSSIDDMPIVASLSDTETRSVTKSLEPLTDVKPQPMTSVVTVVIRVENLDNAVYNGSIYSFGAVTQGFAHGRYFTKDNEFKLSDSELIYYNTITNYTFDEDGVNGYVTYSFNCFGRASEEEYDVNFKVIELSGKLFETDRNITQQVIESEDQVNIYIDLTDEANKITLSPYDGVGFNVSGWGGSETVYL